MFHLSSLHLRLQDEGEHLHESTIRAVTMIYSSSDSQPSSQFILYHCYTRSFLLSINIIRGPWLEKAAPEGPETESNGELSIIKIASVPTGRRYLVV